MNIRNATVADVPAVAALERALFGADAWTEAAVLSELRGAARRALVAVVADEVVGYAVSLRAGEVADLQRIGVHPDLQRQGVANRLLADVLDAARADGAERVLLEVSAANGPALAFYVAAGFVEINRRHRYYRDGSDAVVMRLALAPARGQDPAHGPDSGHGRG